MSANILSHNVNNILKKCTYLLLALMLSACKVELYSGLPEKEGNEIISILLEHDVSAKKETNFKNRTTTVFVEESQLSQSIQILGRYGLPRDDYNSVGEIFKKDGMISSPLEERARYIYALSQEISETLSQLDGVLTARVHIVIPEPNPRVQVSELPSSASVFIKHNDLVQLDVLVPNIKLLVSNSIEGLVYDNVSVVLFPAYVKALDTEVEERSFWSKYWLYFAVPLGLLILIFVGVTMTRQQQAYPGQGGSGTTSVDDGRSGL